MHENRLFARHSPAQLHYTLIHTMFFSFSVALLLADFGFYSYPTTPIYKYADETTCTTFFIIFLLCVCIFFLFRFSCVFLGDDFMGWNECKNITKIKWQTSTLLLPSLILESTIAFNPFRWVFFFHSSFKCSWEEEKKKRKRYLPKRHGFHGDDTIYCWCHTVASP